jgi:two-component system response regulator RegX3
MEAERHALLVEPDGALANTLVAALQTCGFSVEVLGDGNAAAERVNNGKAELILLDVEPALADTVCRQAKKKNKLTPVIVVSGNGDGVFKRLFNRGPDLVLKKPVAVEEVVQHVRQLFNLGPALAASEQVEELDSSALVDAAEENADTDVRDSVAVKKTAATFAKEHEVLSLRQQVNALEKQILDLREEVDRRDRQMLQQKQSTLEIERKANALNDTILGLEQGLLTANERIDELEREEDTLLKGLDAKEHELQAAIAHGKDELAKANAAAAEEAKRQKARADMEHATQLERMRKDQEGATAKLTEQHHAQTQDLIRKHASVVGAYEARLAKAIDTIRANARQVNQAREALNNAGTHLSRTVADFAVERVDDEHKPDHKLELKK